MAKKKVNRQKYQLYRVDWYDAFSAGGGWNSLDKVPESHMLIHSVGWLIKDTKKYFILAQQMSDNKNYSDTINIPKVWIKSKRPLKNWIHYESSPTEN